MKKILEILSSVGKDINLKLFSEEIIEDLERNIYIKETKKGKKFYTKCFIRNKEIQVKPEEVIRQLFLRKLVWEYGYPKKLIEVEYPVYFGGEPKRADIVVKNPKNPKYAYIIVETKKPTLKEGKEQLKSYTNATGAPIAVWTNGERIEVFHRKDPNYFENISDIPKYGQSLRELLKEKFTIEDLKRVDKLTKERISLKDIILDLEDEVLANAGVDVFEEVLKLIFTKLYDELQSFRNPRRPLEFRNYGESDPELKEKIQRLFDEAKRKWEGIFPEDAKIELSPSHLAVCVGSLQDVKIFNTNLDVIDDAFEYLVNKTSKGEKGQYFTPRYVIDMVVKMLNPTEDEYIIDPACGSFGFPIHAVFKVWRDIYEKNGLDPKDLLTAEEKIPEAIDYVREKVFGIDFDEKVVRVAKLLNLIAGDGHSNVIKLNSLDYEQWKEWMDDEDWRDKYYEGWKKLKRLLKDKRSYRDFNFDIVMTNPPFAGDIKESRIIYKYELAQKFDKNCEPTGKYPKKISRDLLFIERALQFLKPGGRLAIVLPQGRLNNASDRCLREWISKHARIIAVIGLHQNVFKPHTGTKTSVLILQKWDDKLCPYREDYPIFFATMQEPSKDSSGEKIYVKYKDFLKWEEEGKIPPLPEDFKKIAKENPEEKVLDNHGHLIVKHDLFSVQTWHPKVKTPEGIAEAFLEFAKKEGLSFVKKNLTPFDEEKYKHLMNRLEAVELKLSEVREDNPDFRIDAEFFKKEFLSSDEILKKGYQEGKYEILHKLAEKRICNIDSFLRILKPFEYLEISKIHLNNGFMYETTTINPIEEKIPDRAKYILKDLDIAVSTVRPNRNAVAFITNAKRLIGTSGFAVIRFKKKNYNPFVFYAFSKSRYFKNYLVRRTTASMYPAVSLRDVYSIPIPLFSPKFQNLIEKIVKAAHHKLEKSKKLYKEAEEILLQELDLKNFKPTDRNYNIISSKSAFLNGRLDAEYYLPKYEEIERKIKAYRGGWDLLINVCKVYDKNFYPKPHEIYHYIELSDIGNYGEILSYTTDFGNNLPSRARRKVKEGQVIVSSVEGSLEKVALITEKKDNLLCSNGFFVVDSEFINSATLLVLFKLEPIRNLMKKLSSGTILQAINREDFNKLPLPLIKQSIQTQIEELINKSFQLRKESKNLLEKAKKLVETAIEKGEEQAMKESDLK